MNNDSGSPAAQDAQLRADIRLLGRILGDTVRDQEGVAVFDLVERIRQTSIRFHRDDDKPARYELEAILDGLSIDDTLHIVRAFSYFSHLANIAEDQNNIRRTREKTLEGGALSHETLTAATRRARATGISDDDLRRFFGEALVSPVLTAHPTEVRRKSTIDREMEIAGLVDRRERMKLTRDEFAADEEQLRRAVLTLWKTNLLRRNKLTVLDEVANGLSFYDHTFLREVPRLHCALEDLLSGTEESKDHTLPSFLRMGSWIGGDRDGNPFVTADVLRNALQLQCRRIVRFYLEELDTLGAELSLAGNLADVTEDLRQLATQTAAATPHRADEPYRLAISWIYARVAATAVTFNVEIGKKPVLKTTPYANSGEFRADLDVLDRSLNATHGAVIARGRLRTLRRAVDCFGFYMTALDIRQNSAVHERTVAELLGVAGVSKAYRDLAEDERIELLSQEIVSSRPIVSPFHTYSDETTGELAIFRAVAGDRKSVV